MNINLFMYVSRIISVNKRSPCVQYIDEFYRLR